jgi:hypothetical protein
VPVFWRAGKVDIKESPKNWAIKAHALLTLDRHKLAKRKVGFFFATVGD